MLFQISSLGKKKRTEGLYLTRQESWRKTTKGFGSTTLSDQGKGTGKQHCHNAPDSAVTSCSELSGKGSLPDSQEPCLSLNWPRSTMGQFLSSTFWEGSPAAVWHEKLHDVERKGAGETIPVLQEHVMCSEEREHGSKHCEVHITQSHVVSKESGLGGALSVTRRCYTMVLYPGSYGFHFCLRLFINRVI